MPPRLTVVHRHDCELCEQMVEDLTRLAARHPLPPLTLVDVDGDAALADLYGNHVPVLLLDGTVVCRHRLDAATLLSRLQAADAAVRPPTA